MPSKMSCDFTARRYAIARYTLSTCRTDSEIRFRGPSPVFVSWCRRYQASTQNKSHLVERIFKQKLSWVWGTWHLAPLDPPLVVCVSLCPSVCLSRAGIV